MIKIVKMPTPPELDNLKQKVMSQNLDPDHEYKKLKNPLKNKVLEQLMKEQGHVCAYCMRTIPDTRVHGTKISESSIEHFVARHSKTGISVFGSGLGVDYSNLLAVCSGGVAPKGTYCDNELTCDKKRGNDPLTVNPLDESTLSTIFYKSNGEIGATDTTINNDLVSTLNLNCVKYSDLPAGRKAALEPIEKYIEELNSDDMLQECKSLLADYESETDPKTPYCGIIIWWLKSFVAEFV